MTHEDEHLFVYAGGHRLHAVAAGSGPLVLLVHGFPEGWFAWRNQLPAIAAAGYRAVAVDMRGYGRSSKPSEIDAYRLTELVQDCVDVVHGLGATEAIVIGHDWGAIVAWTAAWTRPDVFRAVMGMSVAFGGRAQAPLAGISSLGEVRPSEAFRMLAGPDRHFYHENWTYQDGMIAAAEPDLRGFLRDMMFSMSADAAPGDASPTDVLATTPAEVLAITRASPAVVPVGTPVCGVFASPEVVPAWLAEDLDEYAAEFERAGLRAPLNWYRNSDRNWEDLAAFEGRPIEVPSFFLGSDRDLGVLWGVEAIAAFPQTMSHHLGTHIIRDCGHYVQREAPEATNAAIGRFLAGVEAVRRPRRS